MNATPTMPRALGIGTTALLLATLTPGPAFGRPGARRPAARPGAARPRLRFKPKSVWVHKGSIRVWSKPRFGSPLRGAIVKGGRFPVRAVLPPGGGCTHPWYKLGPDAYACSGWLIGSPRPPTRLTDVARSTRHGPWVLNRNRRTFYYPTMEHFARSQPVRLRRLAGFQVLGRRVVGSVGFLRVRHNGWVQEATVKAAPQSTLIGVTIAKPKDLPLAFVLHDRVRLWKQVGHRLVKTHTVLSRHAVRTAHEKRSFKGRCYRRVGSRYWVRCDRIALATKPPPPPKQISGNRNWLDLDTKSRILYARQGTKVARVMLVSLSRKTPKGIFRIREKHVDLDLVQRWGDDPYFLQGVPFVVFFHKNIAIHAAYWHNGFGVHRSHGCVNLSVPDARFVFRFVKPTLPPGYRHIAATPADPGSTLRVRSGPVAATPRTR